MSDTTKKRLSAPITSSLGSGDGRNRRRSASLVPSSRCRSTWAPPVRAVGLFDRWSTEPNGCSASPSTHRQSDADAPPTTGRQRHRRTIVVLVVGDSAVGKSSLIEQLNSCWCGGDRVHGLDQNFTSAVDNIEIRFVKKDLNQIMYPQDLNGLDAMLYVYDVTSLKSFQSSCLALLTYKKFHYLAEIPIFLVANKVDLQRRRVVQETYGRDVTRSLRGCQFLEVSVALGHMIERLLHAVVTATTTAAADVTPTSKTSLANLLHRRPSAFVNGNDDDARRRRPLTLCRSVSVGAQPPAAAAFGVGRHLVDSWRSVVQRLTPSCTDL